MKRTSPGKCPKRKKKYKLAIRHELRKISFKKTNRVNEKTSRSIT